MCNRNNKQNQKKYKLLSAGRTIKTEIFLFLRLLKILKDMKKEDIGDSA